MIYPLNGVNCTATVNLSFPLVPDVIGEQYIEYPRALCTTDGLPVKGQKCIATNFYTARYSAAAQDLVLHSFPPNWIPDVAILEGMFLLNTKPLHCHKVMRDYGNFKGFFYHT